MIFDGFLKRRIPGKNGEGTPRNMFTLIYFVTRQLSVLCLLVPKGIHTVSCCHVFDLPLFSGWNQNEGYGHLAGKKEAFGLQGFEAFAWVCVSTIRAVSHVGMWVCPKKESADLVPS